MYNCYIRLSSEYCIFVWRMLLLEDDHRLKILTGILHEVRFICNFWVHSLKCDKFAVCQRIQLPYNNQTDGSLNNWVNRQCCTIQSHPAYYRISWLINSLAVYSSIIWSIFMLWTKLQLSDDVSTRPCMLLELDEILHAWNWTIHGLINAHLSIPLFSSFLTEQYCYFLNQQQYFIL